MLHQRLGIRIQRREHEAAITLHPIDPPHVVLRIVEAEAFRIAFPVRHRGERSVGAEDPGVIGAAEQAAGTLVDHADARAAMRAAIVQHVDLPVIVARDHHFVLC